MGLVIDGMTPLLQVFDMPRAIRFYRDVLGFDRVSDSGPVMRNGTPTGDADDVDWCWLRRGTVDLMLNTMFEWDSRPPVPPAERVAAHNDTTLYFGCADPQAAWAYLRVHGVDADPPADQSYGMTQVYARDPDGYNLCFQSETRRRVDG